MRLGKETLLVLFIYCSTMSWTFTWIKPVTCIFLPPGKKAWEPPGLIKLFPRNTNNALWGQPWPFPSYIFFSLEQIKPIVLCSGACALHKCFWASVCSSCCCCLSLIFASLFFFCQTLFRPHGHYFQIVVGGETS